MLYFQPKNFNNKSLLIFALFISTIMYAQLPTVPTGYSSTTVQTGYNNIMGSVFSEDGSQMFVWEKDGRVYVSNWNGTTYVKQNTAVLDINDEVGGWRDFGLISIALDPDFSSNGLIYLSYMVDREHLMHVDNPADPNPNPAYDPNNNAYEEATITRLTRYKINLGSNPLTTDYTSRKVLLGESPTTGIPLLHESHAGGAILFGDDGTLIMTTGDNASYFTTDTGSVDHTYYAQAIADGIMRADENVGAFRSQMINSFCGKVLRMDPDTGDGLSSNPHYDSNNPRSAQSRVYAMGLRNPFRMSIKKGRGSTNPADGNPGTLFVVDVGYNTWEDLHIFDKPGLNAGWPLYEGQTQLNSYYNSGTTNPDETGNPTFQSLCVQPTSFTDDVNPANRRYTHNRPEVAWRHGSTPDARVPWFSGATPTDPRVGTAGSPTTGVQFTGNTGVSGLYLNDCGLGSDYEGKYFFTDYVRNFINVATLNDGTANWISDIEEFAPSNFGSGIVHMAQNPIDGSIYYSNIYTGNLDKITYDTPADPTWTVEPSDSIVDCDANSVTAFTNWLASFSGEDECGAATVTHNSSGLSDDCGDTGNETVTFTLTSYHGNTISKDATFTVVDTADPTWKVEPSDYLFSCDEVTDPADVFNTWLLSFSGEDACGTAAVSNNNSGLSFDCDSVGAETVTYTLTDLCGNDITKQATFNVENTLGVETEVLGRLKMYPNPTENMVTISGLKSEANMVVYDILGKQVENLLVKNNQKVNLELPSGIYLVKIIVNDKSTIKKLIIK